MGTCKYCGKNAGLFSSSHKECNQLHDDGLKQTEHILADYFSGKLKSSDLTSKISVLKKTNYMSSEDLVVVAGKTLDAYTNTIHRPFSQNTIDIVTGMVSAIGEPYSVIDKTGAITRFAQKLIKGYVAGYFANGDTLSHVQQQVANLMHQIPINTEKVCDSLYYMLNKAADNFSKDGTLTGQELALIKDYSNSFGISMTNLPANYQGGSIEKVSQSVLLNDLQQGRLPNTTNIQLPILLTKGESLLWTYNGVTLYLEKIEREFVGQHSGFSFRVAKGVTYRVGGSKGHPIEHSHMENMGQGSLYLTNKNMIYYSPTKSVKIPYSKLIGITPYTDGIEVHKDGAAKRMTFQGFDSWFIMNLLSIINNL